VVDEGQQALYKELAAKSNFAPRARMEEEAAK